MQSDANTYAGRVVQFAGMKNNEWRGFSLVELTAVVAILGVLTLLIVPRLSNHQSQAKKSTCYAIQAEIELQVQLWKRNTGSYPAAN
jgi:prepilin-type N-terminal cleavage/methylation domain-containing protein